MASDWCEALSHCLNPATFLASAIAVMIAALLQSMV
jgi:hypothetical protein